MDIKFASEWVQKWTGLPPTACLIIVGLGFWSWHQSNRISALKSDLNRLNNATISALEAVRRESRMPADSAIQESLEALKKLQDKNAKYDQKTQERSEAGGESHPASIETDPMNRHPAEENQN